MLGAAIAALAVAHAAGFCPAGPPSGVALISNPQSLVAGRPGTLCLYPLPGPPGRSFDWDLGSDGSVDATTVDPQLEVAAAPPTVLKVTVRYTATLTSPVGTTSNVPYTQSGAFPVQDAPPPPAPVRPATVRVENDTLIYQGSPDVSDHIYGSEETPYRWEMTGGAVEPGAGCMRESQPTALVTCPATHSVDVTLGDHGKNVFSGSFGDDWRFTSVKVIGGVKSDWIAASGPAAATIADGGAGNDNVSSTGVALGGPGDDRVAGPNAVGGPGNDRLKGNTGRLDGGPGNDTARVRGRNVTVLLGPGNDVFIGYGLGVRVYGGPGNDLFRVPLFCTCGLFGEAGNDTFHTVTSLIGGPGPARSQFVLGGPGRDSALLDGSDCAKGVERITRSRLTGSDGRYRCRPPSVNLRP